MVSKPLTTQGYSLAEEIANSISHGVGLVFGIVGLVLLLVQAVDTNASALAITSYSLYGGSMILLFLASTLYHAIPYQRAKIWLKKFDHCAILSADCRDLHTVFAGGVGFTAGARINDCYLEPGATGDPV
ncbi:hemolysin [Leclercia adecarboxylata]|uniref:Hemolysin n=1 Tax=Leclercia adecarboxylata TaxID=83655 RepID=A0A4U9IIP7_9ENTR|nr:hemolysin [Leclercia adecarboxylata]